ncbi:hypothetical protein HAX54_041883, partial [Datura stramonium]|nr:hypothetical protein [Datura stramonium]
GKFEVKGIDETSRKKDKMLRAKKMDYHDPSRVAPNVVVLVSKKLEHAAGGFLNSPLKLNYVEYGLENKVRKFEKYGNNLQGMLRDNPSLRVAVISSRVIYC